MITEPSVREMFFYFVLSFGAIVLVLLALLSPLILGEVVNTLKGRLK